MNLIYMAKPIYGGWVTFTSHLCLKYNCELFKIGKRTEKQNRRYGYGVDYRNLKIDDILSLKNKVITAVDKNYWEHLHLFPKGTMLIIHDPTELKGKNNPLKDMLNHFKIITIRKTVQDFLKKEYNVDSDFILHPFYEYPKSDEKSEYYSTAISRIDFDKHTDIILKSNKLIEDENKHIYIFGAENRLYVHHKLKDLDFPKYWKGKYPKELPMKYEGKDLLNNCKFMVDMSIIKGDGGGTQYTFLEAIYHGCVLILHHDWVSQGDLFKHNENCLVVGSNPEIKPEEEIAKIINDDEEYCNIIKNSRKILEDHIEIHWF